MVPLMKQSLKTELKITNVNEIKDEILLICGRSVVQVLVVRVDMGVVIYEAMGPQCGRSVVQVLVVRVDIGVVIYEAITPQCGRSVGHFPCG